MRKEIAAEDGISAWQRVAEHVSSLEPTVGGCVPPLVLGDNWALNVNADVLETTKLQVLHPIHVAARSVEERADPKIAEQCGHALTECACLGKTGPRSGERFTPVRPV